MMIYDLAEIAKYRTPYVGDASKIGQIATSLRFPNAAVLQI